MSSLIERQAAIDAVRKAKDKSEAHRMLVQLPSAQLAQDLTNGCTDTISRVAAISICDNAIDLWNGQLGTGALVAVRDAIMALPSAQPVVISKSENTTECEDAVSREAVLNEIHRYMEERDYTIGLLDDNVCGLPPVTPKQPGWIPTSERLPERYDNYLITTKDEDTDIGTFHPEFKQWSICDADGFKLTDGVLAWQPLPKPWENE